MNEKLKLYRCDIIDDCENDTILVIDKSEDGARKQIEDMDFSCLMSISVFEINDIDGHKIVVQ